MALCNGPCCNAEKREEQRKATEEVRFMARLGFYRKLAQERGQTVDRVVPAGDLSALLVRPNEPENIKSEESTPASSSVVVFAPRCTCTDCPCDNIQTIANPKRCAECLKGVHSRVGGA